MTEVRLRNVDPWVVEVIRGMAKRNNLTAEEQIKQFLVTLANQEKNALLDELRQGRMKQREKYGVLPDSTPGIREERDKRW